MRSSKALSPRRAGTVFLRQTRHRYRSTWGLMMKSWRCSFWLNADSGSQASTQASLTFFALRSCSEFAAYIYLARQSFGHQGEQGGSRAVLCTGRRLCWIPSLNVLAYVVHHLLRVTECQQVLRDCKSCLHLGLPIISFGERFDRNGHT